MQFLHVLITPSLYLVLKIIKVSLCYFYLVFFTEKNKARNPFPEKHVMKVMLSTKSLIKSQGQIKSQYIFQSSVLTPSKINYFFLFRDLQGIESLLFSNTLFSPSINFIIRELIPYGQPKSCMVKRKSSCVASYLCGWAWFISTYCMLDVCCG